MTDQSHDLNPELPLYYAHWTQADWEAKRRRDMIDSARHRVTLLQEQQRMGFYITGAMIDDAQADVDRLRDELKELDE